MPVKALGRRVVSASDQSGSRTLSSQLTTEITRPPSTADQNPSTSNGTPSLPAIHEVSSSMSALTTSVNNPNVMMYRGARAA